MGTKSRQEMHSIVYDAAIEKGPNSVFVKGKQYAAYSMTKNELAKLFESGGYSSDRITWLKVIRSWREYFGDIAPGDTILFNKGAQWMFIIGLMYPEDQNRLFDYAGAHKIPVILGLKLDTSECYDITDFGVEEA